MSASSATQKNADRYFREVLGLKVGDIVETSYGTGPYEVWYVTPARMVTHFVHALIVRSWPVIDLAVVTPNERSHRLLRGDFSYINNIRREGKRWFTDQQDEVFVRERGTALVLPIHPTWSYPPSPSPYAFQSGVDYHAGHRRVWHCEACGRDWNEAEERRPWEPARCPLCTRVGIPVVLMDDPASGQSEYVLALNS